VGYGGVVKNENEGEPAHTGELSQQEGDPQVKDHEKSFA
jgi:hypothetical protein